MAVLPRVICFGISVMFNDKLQLKHFSCGDIIRRQGKGHLESDRG